MKKRAINSINKYFAKALFVLIRHISIKICYIVLCD